MRCGIGRRKPVNGLIFILNLFSNRAYSNAKIYIVKAFLTRDKKNPKQEGIRIHWIVWNLRIYSFPPCYVYVKKSCVLISLGEKGNRDPIRRAFLNDTRLSWRRVERAREKEDFTRSLGRRRRGRLYYEGWRETFIILFRQSEASNLVL